LFAYTKKNYRATPGAPYIPTAKAGGFTAHFGKFSLRDTEEILVAQPIFLAFINAPFFNNLAGCHL
jgi:hypothetical protein